MCIVCIITVSVLSLFQSMFISNDFCADIHVSVSNQWICDWLVGEWLIKAWKCSALVTFVCLVIFMSKALCFAKLTLCLGVCLFLELLKPYTVDLNYLMHCRSIIFYPSLLQFSGSHPFFHMHIGKLTS